MLICFLHRSSFRILLHWFSCHFPWEKKAHTKESSGQILAWLHKVCNPTQSVFLSPHPALLSTQIYRKEFSNVKNGLASGTELIQSRGPTPECVWVVSQKDMCFFSQMLSIKQEKTISEPRTKRNREWTESIKGIKKHLGQSYMRMLNDNGLTEIEWPIVTACQEHKLSGWQEDGKVGMQGGDRQVRYSGSTGR